MVEKFQNKYRIASARLQSWDYGSNGLYFVSICTKDREHYFGEIIDGKMQLSEIGKNAQKYWCEIPEHFPFVILDEFVVMPNHLHGIVVINKTNDGNNGNQSVAVETPNLDVSTDTDNNCRTAAATKKWKSGTLGVIINQYKRIVCIESREIDADFAWQSRFHDHIIRNNLSDQNIRNYIINNPKKWQEEK